MKIGSYFCFSPRLEANEEEERFIPLTPIEPKPVAPVGQSWINGMIRGVKDALGQGALDAWKARAIKSLDGWVSEGRVEEAKENIIVAIQREDVEPDNTLDLSNCLLTTLPPVIWELTGLTTLAIRNNKLTSIEGVGKLTRLKKLIAERNLIETIPAEIGMLVQLEQFRIYENKLSAIPPQIGALVNLRELIINGNQLQEVPPQIGSLRKLTSLNVSDNQIRSLPDSLVELVGLRMIRASSNRLTSLPAAMDRLQNLQVLDVSHNTMLAGLPEVLSSCPLTHLMLGGIHSIKRAPLAIERIPGIEISLDDLKDKLD